MQRTWTDVGRVMYEPGTDDYERPKDETGQHFTQDMIVGAIDALDWQPTEGVTTLPMVPGLGIKHAITELRIPKVSHFAIGNGLAPYGLYGIEGHYKNGRARVYVIDRGSDLLPVASDFWGNR
jgi:hypothetical protein